MICDISLDTCFVFYWLQNLDVHGLMQCLCAGLDKKATSKVRIINCHFSMQHSIDFQQGQQSEAKYYCFCVFFGKSSSYLSFWWREECLLGFSHLSVCCATVTRVENTSTTSEAQALGPEISKQTTQPSRLEARSCLGIEERLRNMETHLGYCSGSFVKWYQQLLLRYKKLLWTQNNGCLQLPKKKNKK